MSSSPEVILRGAGARGAITADFTVDLGSAMPIPSTVVTQAREAARTTGYADGWAQGQRAGRAIAHAAADQLAVAAEAAAQAQAVATRRALSAVARAADDLDARSMPTLESISELVLSAAIDIAEALLGYEVSHAESAPQCSGALAAVRRAMSLVPDGGPVTVRLHPDDFGCLVRRGDTALHAGHATAGHATAGAAGHAAAGTAAAGASGHAAGVLAVRSAATPRSGESTYAFEGRAITVRADPELAPGDAIAEYGVTTVDARLAAAVARVREVLGR